jgi:2-oxoglutarate ferredoxin oxidoreductase subunit delta
MCVDMKKAPQKQAGGKDKPELRCSRAERPVSPQGIGTPEAVQPVVIQVPKGKLALIKDRCKGCGFCIEFCPKKVLEFSSESNAKGYHVPEVKNPDQCILCGFCSMYCPDFAIYQIKNDKTDKK